MLFHGHLLILALNILSVLLFSVWNLRLPSTPIILEITYNTVHVFMCDYNYIHALNKVYF